MHRVHVTEEIRIVCILGSCTRAALWAKSAGFVFVLAVDFGYNQGQLLLSDEVPRCTTGLAPVAEVYFRDENWLLHLLKVLRRPT
jgi:hypothetical protein